MYFWQTIVNSRTLHTSPLYRDQDMQPNTSLSEIYRESVCCIPFNLVEFHLNFLTHSFSIGFNVHVQKFGLFKSQSDLVARRWRLISFCTAVPHPSSSMLSRLDSICGAADLISLSCGKL